MSGPAFRPVVILWRRKPSPNGAASTFLVDYSGGLRGAIDTADKLNDLELRAAQQGLTVLAMQSEPFDEVELHALETRLGKQIAEHPATAAPQRGDGSQISDATKAHEGSDGRGYDGELPRILPESGPQVIVVVGANGSGKSALLWVCGRHAGVSVIDELGAHTHPSAQEELVRQCKTRGVPMVVATHCPYLLDAVALENVWVLHRPEAVGPNMLTITAARLDAHPEAERWRHQFSPGEFWSSVGEEWVLEQAEPTTLDELATRIVTQARGRKP
jgi:hypothetical protein